MGLKLDKKRSYGMIYGVYEKAPEAAFEQDGNLYRGDGSLIEIRENGVVVVQEAQEETVDKSRSEKMKQAWAKRREKALEGFTDGVAGQ